KPQTSNNKLQESLPHLRLHHRILRNLQHFIVHMHVCSTPTDLHVSSFNGGIMICFLRTLESFPHKFTKTLLVTLGNQYNLECSVTRIGKWREMKVWSDGLRVHYFGHDIFS